jgi:hypothetical protein
MSGLSTQDSVVGNQQVNFYGGLDSTDRQMPGQMFEGVDQYWGFQKAQYVRANGAIRQFGLCVITPVFDSALGRYRYDATEVPNTANLGRNVCVAASVMTSGQYGWVIQQGLSPVNCTASVAADTAWGIAAAGQGGAIANGKQIVNSRIIAPATTTVAKTNCSASFGSKQLTVSNSDGWFTGAYLSGTGIAAGTTVTSIDPSGRFITLSLATTAAVTGTVTATYNNGTVFYNVARLEFSFAQGQIV